MMWNLILLYSALAVLSESQSLQEVGWVPCELVEEYNQPDSSGNIETHYKRRNAVLQFSHPGDSAVNPDSITFFVMASKVDMRKYVQAGVEQVQCDIHRYNAGGIEARWPGPGAQEHDRWFTCTLRHSEGLFILTTFLRYTPTVAQADDAKWVIEDRDRLITTAAMLVMTRSPSVEVGLLREQILHCQFAVDHKQPELVLEWRVQKRGERSKLFSYSSRSGQSEGAGVSLRDIAAGLGSLRLPATTLASEGTYICSVYVPPLYGSHDLALHIVESPQVTLNVAAPCRCRWGRSRRWCVRHRDTTLWMCRWTG
ncbi:hypothetical protein AGOR_G00171100 [Albula goreensis]|uniref:Ig-like domain-containing protein n=1 Tax=Albula goreensis TaxID=1534307 RepID=A0A8T3D3J2_9TELE|nr:hypothetical protein AGOR_G00171100 [Albula goreensis]